MSKEIVCDRCGKSSRDFKTYGKLNQVRATPFRGISDLENSTCNLNIDLCDNCIEDLINGFLKEYKE